MLAAPGAMPAVVGGPAAGSGPQPKRKGSGPVVKKTPIALLHEMCSKRKLGVVPEYKLTGTTGPVHAAEFTVQVSLGDMVATGADHSKQRARQAAAMHLLLNLVGLGWEVMPGLQPHLAAEYVKSLMPEPVAPGGNRGGGGGGKKQKRGSGEGDGEENGDGEASPPAPSPVSQLNELCMRQRWPLPVFVTQDATGGGDPATGAGPKVKEYTTRARVGGFEQSATASSKKDAKRQAAVRLLAVLQGNATQDHLGSMAVDQNITAEVLKAMADLVSARQNGEKLSPSVVNKIQDALKAVQKAKGGKGAAAGADNVVLLAKVLDRCGFRATVHDVERASDAAEFECIYQLDIPGRVVCYGSGPSLETARNGAAKAALQYLKLVVAKCKVEE